MRRFFGLAALAASLLVIAPVSASAFGDKCYPALKAKGGWEHNKHDAMSVAMDAWEKAATKKYGGNYDNWDYSGDRTMDCKWDDNGSHFNCTASARPCGRYHSH